MIRVYWASVRELVTLAGIKSHHAPPPSAYIIPTPVSDPE